MAAWQFYCMLYCPSAITPPSLLFPVCGNTAHIWYSSPPLRVLLSPWYARVTPTAVNRNYTRASRREKSLAYSVLLIILAASSVDVSSMSLSLSWVLCTIASWLLGSAALLSRCLASWFSVHAYTLKCLHPAKFTSCSVPMLDDRASSFLFMQEYQFITSLPADWKWSESLKLALPNSICSGPAQTSMLKCSSWWKIH